MTSADSWNQSAPIRLLEPKLVKAFREGYSLGQLRHDALAGLAASILAIPLCMAIAIAAGAAPEKGPVTGIVAGFLVYALAAAATRLVRCRSRGSRLNPSGLQSQPCTALHRAGFLHANRVIVARDISAALDLAQKVLP